MSSETETLFWEILLQKGKFKDQTIFPKTLNIGGKRQDDSKIGVLI